MDIDHLRQLEAAATPGEWAADRHVEPWLMGKDTGCMVRIWNGNTGVALLNVKADGPRRSIDPVADAAFIIALRNAAPELLTLAERAAAALEQVSEALEWLDGPLTSSDKAAVVRMLTAVRALLAPLSPACS